MGEYDRAMQHIREEMSGVQARLYTLETGGGGNGDTRSRAEDVQPLMIEEWSNEKDCNFNDLPHGLFTFMNVISKEAKTMMEEGLKLDEWEGLVDVDDAEYPNEDFLDGHLYATLSKIMTAEPKAVVRNVVGSGMVAWHSIHKHYNPKATTDASVSIRKMINPQTGKHDETTKVALDNSETAIREHENRHGKVKRVWRLLDRRI